MRAIVGLIPDDQALQGLATHICCSYLHEVRGSPGFD